MKSVRTWVVGGLGSQLDSLAAGIFVAKSTGRQLVIDLSIVETATSPSRRANISSLDLQGASPVIVSVLGSPRAMPLGIVRRGYRRSLHLLADKEILTTYAHGFEELRVRDPHRVRWIGGNMGPWSIRSAALEAGLRPDILAQGGCSKMSREVDLEDNWVAVHVRLGDFRQYANGKFMLEADYYRQSIRRLGISSPRIALFSDEPKSAERLLVQSGVNASHIWDFSSTSPIQDLRQMSRFHSIICSHSSFSWWAAICAKEARVCVPQSVLVPTGTRHFAQWQGVPGT